MAKGKTKRTRMEKEVQESVESPWLLYRNRDEKGHFFRSASHPHRTIPYCNPVLLDKWILNYSHGWLLLYGHRFRFMLFNPNTNRIINLPVLLWKPRRSINAGCLWLSPENPMSKVLLFDEGRSTIVFCSVHKKEWIEVSYKTQAEKIIEDRRRIDGFAIRHPVNCNGRVYALMPSGPPYKLVEIDIPEGTCCLQIKSLEIEVPAIKSHSSLNKSRGWWLVESRGELFVVNTVFGGARSAEILDVGVFRWDFNSLEQGWRDVKGSEIKDQAFFLSYVFGGSQSLSCTTRGQEFEGGCVYFRMKGGGPQGLCSFDVEDGSITVAPPSGLFYPRVWIMTPNSRGDREETMKKKKKTSTENFSKHEGINFLNLPYDIMEKVAKKVRPVDCMNLRATGKACCRLAPPTRWRTSSSVNEQPHSLPPWVMFSRSDRTMHHFIDMKFGGIFTIEADKLLYGAKIRCSRDGWVLMTNIGENLFFFYNPFTAEVIKLLEAPEHATEYDSFCFTGIPSSSECMVMGVRYESVCYFDTRQQRWGSLRLPDTGEYGGDLWIHSTPVFFRGAFYFLGTLGNLYKLTLENGRVTMFDRLYCASVDFCQNFLLEWDGKLACVFVPMTLTSLQVLILSEGTRQWEEVSSLGKWSFFVSSCSAFSITTNIPELEDKIYLSKIYGEDKIIFYCLKSKRFGFSTSGEKIDDCCCAKDYLSSCWIQPSRARSR